MSEIMRFKNAVRERITLYKALREQLAEDFKRLRILAKHGDREAMLILKRGYKVGAWPKEM